MQRHKSSESTALSAKPGFIVLHMLYRLRWAYTHIQRTIYCISSFITKPYFPRETSDLHMT